jgi:hypothetical protein
LASVNGQPLTEMGKAVFSITLGNLTLDPFTLAKALDLSSRGFLEFGIFLNSFVEITVLAAPVSAVKVTLIPCILPST